jgi:hypothetical protein
LQQADPPLLPLKALSEIQKYFDFSFVAEVQNIEYTVLSIQLEEFSLPPVPLIDVPDEDDAMWHYSFSILFETFTSERIIITATVGSFLYLKEDSAKTPIISIETSTSFSITKELSNDAKLLGLINLLNIAQWNLQGIYAVKTEDTNLEEVLPPDFPTAQHVDSLKKQIHDDWK